MLWENKGVRERERERERGGERHRKVFMIVLMASWKRVYVYTASLVGRKEELRRHFSS